MLDSLPASFLHRSEGQLNSPLLSILCGIILIILEMGVFEFSACHNSYSADS